MPSISATAAVSSSPAPAATTLPPDPMTSIVPAPRSTTTASSRPPGVVRAPSRAAAGSLTGSWTGTPSRSPSTDPASSSPARLSEATRTARPVLPCRAVAASAAAARSTANRSSTSLATASVPYACMAPTGQPASRGHAARSVRRPSPAVSTHGSAGPSDAPGARGQQADHGIGLVGQHPAQRGRVTRLGISQRVQAEAGAERNRVGQHPQGVPGRAHLDREHPARGGRVRVYLVDDRQAAGEPVRHQHALVAGHQHRADPGPGRQQGPQACGGRVVAQAGRHDRHDLGVARLGARRRPARARRRAAGAARRRPRSRRGWARPRPARAAGRPARRCRARPLPRCPPPAAARSSPRRP